MARRKLNDLERRLHQAALAKLDNIISQDEINGLEPRSTERLSALNFLLATGLLVVLRGGQRSGLLYKALPQDVIETKKGLTQEEILILDYIRAAGNQGIWTKHIKTQTQLHQTVVDKCLKSLTQRQLVKTVPDVRHTTRKTYMLAELEPSIELTGGPWFTDKELDTEFIKLLSDVCLKIVRDRSLPKSISGESSRDRKLYPLSYSSYPTADQILDVLRRSRVTETELTVQHVEMLLEVLILDGKTEKLPAFHIPDSMWDIDEHSEEVDLEAKRSKRRRRQGSESETDTGDDSDSSGEDERTSYKRRRPTSGDSESSRKRKERNLDTDSEHLESSRDADLEQMRTRRRRRPDTGSIDDSTTDEDEPRTKKRRQGQGAAGDIGSFLDTSATYVSGSPIVYRAIYEESVTMGINQAPCAVCPVFDFCRDGGPVNPKECAYYQPWLSDGAGSVATGQV